MAKKKTNEEQGGALVEAAKTVGEAAGKVVNAVEAIVPKKSSKVPKLEKKNKSRLPRKEKKAKAKAHAAAAQKEAMKRKGRKSA